MGWKLKFRKENHNNANNNGTIQINTSTDVLYKIGKDIGDIKMTTIGITDKIRDIDNRLENHEKRLKKLENSRK